MSKYTDKTKKQFDPKNLPRRSTPVFDIDGRRIGTFNPHTNIIHPTSDSLYGALKILGNMALNFEGKLVGNFNALGQLQPIENDEPAASA
jgi:hypothetical protein